MILLRAWARRVSSLFGKTKIEQELDAELRTHIEMLTREHVDPLVALRYE